VERLHLISEERLPRLTLRNYRAVRGKHATFRLGAWVSVNAKRPVSRLWADNCRYQYPDLHTPDLLRFCHKTVWESSRGTGLDGICFEISDLHCTSTVGDDVWMAGTNRDGNSKK